MRAGLLELERPLKGLTLFQAFAEAVEYQMMAARLKFTVLGWLDLKPMVRSQLAGSCCNAPLVKALNLVARG